MDSKSKMVRTHIVVTTCLKQKLSSKLSLLFVHNRKWQVMSWKKCAKIWPKKLSESTRWLKQEVPKLICLHVASAKRRTVHTPRYTVIQTLCFPFSKLKSYIKMVREKKVLITKWTFNNMLTNYKIGEDSWIYLGVLT